MISSAIIPQPLARLPWRLIFLIAGISGIGIITLYSAAGGSAQPWATKQAIVILFFLAIAITMSWSSEATIKKVAFPLYGAVLVMLVVVERGALAGRAARYQRRGALLDLPIDEAAKGCLVQRSSRCRRT